MVVVLLMLCAVGCSSAAPSPTLPPSETPQLLPTTRPTRISTVELSPTFTPLPTDTATPIPPTWTPSPIPPPDAEVIAGADALRLRDQPGTGGNIISHLSAFMPLRIIGRTNDSQWVQVVTPAGAVGWVGVEFLKIHTSLDKIVITGQVVNAAIVPTAPAVSVPQPYLGGAITNVTSRSRDIFLHGRMLGNRADVFSKVGDSLTVAAYVYTPIGLGQFNLRSYGSLLSVIQHFSGTTNSFAYTPFAANNGWTTDDILNAAKANPAACRPGEIPLACEYRIMKPSVALILIGTNDVASTSADHYAANLHRIVDMSIDAGVVPVLTTIPTRVGFEAQAAQFNQIIRDTSQSYSIPLSDFGGVLQRLPDHGLSPDGVHPSYPPGDYNVATDFTPQNLTYGYTVRNLMILQILDALWRQVLY
jgi:hypothetical protein